MQHRMRVLVDEASKAKERKQTHGVMKDENKYK